MASLSLGYHLGVQSTIPPLQLPSQDIKVQKEEEIDEDEDESMADGDLSTIKAGFREPCKLVRLGRPYHVYSATKVNGRYLWYEQT